MNESLKTIGEIYVAIGIIVAIASLIYQCRMYGVSDGFWGWLGGVVWNVGLWPVMLILYILESSKSLTKNREDKILAKAKSDFIVYSTRNLPQKEDISEKTEKERIQGEKFREEMKAKEELLRAKRKERMQREQEKTKSSPDLSQ